MEKSIKKSQQEYHREVYSIFNLNEDYINLQLQSQQMNMYYEVQKYWFLQFSKKTLKSNINFQYFIVKISRFKHDLHLNTFSKTPNEIN